MLPRFVPSGGAPRDAVLDDPSTIEDIRCLVRLRGDVELVIATELGGGVRVFDRHAPIPHRARTQLAFHEVASAHVVSLDVDELHVLDLQTLEMLPDAPGPNDALYVYGALRGPYPAVLGKRHASVDGQLTVTRADLLGGLVEGVASAFSYAPDQHGSRCVHALLPGARADEIDRGRAVILALPLTPGWLLDSPVPNDRIVAQLVYDLLVALRADLAITGSALPVPSRAVYEQQLVAAGWRIEGNEAVRPKGRGLSSIFKGEDRRALPREGTLDELVGEAKLVLARMAPIAPTAEMAAIRRRIRGDVPRHAAPIAAPPVAPVAPIITPAPPPRVAPRPRVSTDRSDWMKDFVDEHRAPARKPPRVSTPARVVSPAATPAWMSDFDDPDEDD